MPGWRQQFTARRPTRRGFHRGLEEVDEEEEEEEHPSGPKVAGTTLGSAGISVPGDPTVAALGRQHGAGGGTLCCGVQGGGDPRRAWAWTGRLRAGPALRGPGPA